ncbi:MULTISPECIES: L-fuconate dehydratase [unclassified Rathayibacter]|uniref:L-fuconate dehydratase n=1 Tax=unclassified Rathayibacter TaxID=2609250 RepID=UPI000F4C6624|nr:MULTISPECIES: L-fuconate dehydratase [unclassified Rathayibacter]ROP49170.1 L-fuconate dehydratase [Rathayibacter sp. PhB186]ROS50713.1 L-fuconate dehydratase [Rathayibacter sp. PhB185]
MTTITSVRVHDVRFPTSLSMDGSDAMNKDGDYSAAYVVLETDEPGLAGYGFTFTIGRGNDLCVAAALQRAQPLIGRDVDAAVADLGGVYRDLASDSQLRWLGPEKGVVHLAMAAVMNAMWDLAARRAGKPLWRLLAEMTPEELVDVADLRYLSDVLTRDEAIAMLTEMAPSRAERIADLESLGGYPCYTTSAGWLGYSDDKLRRLLQEAVDEGYRHLKLKVGSDIDEDIRRLRIAREVIGWEADLMIDANQVWDVPEAIEWVSRLAEFKPLWIEEPTSPDDVLGHAAIRKAVAPIGVATGEHGMNRVLFKQMFQAEAIDFCQLDSARLASVNEILSVYLMAKKFNVPVCPHAGGVGLCELVQHLSIFDYVAVSGSLDQRVTEYVDHLHEHFTDPCIVENGHYRLPSLPGYSAQMHEASVAEWEYPNGGYWAATLGETAVTG